MAPRLEVRGQGSWGSKAICQVASDGHALEIFVTGGVGDSYRLVVTPEEIYRWAQARYGAPPEPVR